MMSAQEKKIRTERKSKLFASMISLQTALYAEWIGMGPDCNGEFVNLSSDSTQVCMTELGENELCKVIVETFADEIEEFYLSAYRRYQAGKVTAVVLVKFLLELLPLDINVLSTISLNTEKEELFAAPFAAPSMSN